MAVNPEDERLLRRNWTFLKQELRVEDFVHRFVEHEIFTSGQRSDILNPMPNTHSMRCEKFLQAVIASGHRGFLAFCNYLKDNADNRYSRVISVLELNTRKYSPTLSPEGLKIGRVYRVKSGNVGHQVYSDIDLVCFIF